MDEPNVDESQARPRGAPCDVEVSLAQLVALVAFTSSAVEPNVDESQARPRGAPCDVEVSLAQLVALVAFTSSAVEPSAAARNTARWSRVASIE